MLSKTVFVNASIQAKENTRISLPPRQWHAFPSPSSPIPTSPASSWPMFAEAAIAPDTQKETPDQNKHQAIAQLPH